MGPLDVRDVSGRLWRMFWSVLAGAQIAVIVALVLPQRSLNGWGGGAFGGANTLLVGAGALGLALAINALLAALMRRPPRTRIRLPRARLVRGRC